MTNTFEHKLLTPTQAADILQRSVPALAALRYRGNGPRYIKSGALVRYRLSDIESWLIDGSSLSSK
jgi:hypothetical protein